MVRAAGCGSCAQLCRAGSGLSGPLGLLAGIWWRRSRGSSAEVAVAAADAVLMRLVAGATQYAADSDCVRNGVIWATAAARSRGVARARMWQEVRTSLRVQASAPAQLRTFDPRKENEQGFWV